MIQILYIGRPEHDLDHAAQALQGSRDSFDVATESDPQEALERLRSGGFDCVVCDYDLSGTTGAELLERIHEVDPELPAVLLVEGTGEDAADSIPASAIECLRPDRTDAWFESVAKRIERAVERYGSGRTNRREPRRSALFENTPDPIVEVAFDGEIPRMVAVNPAFEEVFGFENDTVIGESIADVLVPESEHAQHLTLRDAVLAGNPT
ncbi:PAS domain S-box protein [Natronomonas sp. F2-12]|uniref:PAS domain S-box protein n=1 Tax=Natronomonas aquatica TaxID=2841590 RepID=A0A9R1CSB2_9EURY|nr:PAS domain S-box protein [Natronomonas aquatica]MCQ4332784.1 PAS domain S-box protein [Natronomonas aquatica]